MELPGELSHRLASFRHRLGARAAGIWRVSVDRLEQLVFDPAPDLSADIARGFAEATRSVDLTRLELAIARAASTRQVVISIAAELPAEVGSGYWLRAFGAARSVAVPVLNPDGSTAFVISIALELEPDAGLIANSIRHEFSEIVC